MQQTSLSQRVLILIVCVPGCLGLLVGCDRTNPSNREVYTEHHESPPAVHVDPNKRIDVEVPGDRKPAVDVHVNPQGGAEVNIDRDKIRERIDERRDQREENQKERSQL